jgi:rubredoxin
MRCPKCGSRLKEHRGLYSSFSEEYRCPMCESIYSEPETKCNHEFHAHREFYSTYESLVRCSKCGLVKEE